MVWIVKILENQDDFTLKISLMLINYNEGLGFNY